MSTERNCPDHDMVAKILDKMSEVIGALVRVTDELDNRITKLENDSEQCRKRRRVEVDTTSSLSHGDSAASNDNDAPDESDAESRTGRIIGGSDNTETETSYDTASS